MDSAILIAIFVLTGVIVFSMVLMIALWNSIKRAYATNNHIVPTVQKVGLFKIGFCTVVVPLCGMIYLITLV